ncbi:hypothetical protein [Hymenobacter guriensis]|uniref:DUF4468 domain-containing protein n=1 Tax=Hymenobacter guriensis TaxID=2793065 RepID=A0ABS0KX62_9BACT|nr:hypothetical protein [Hymenobacter guriensis]MBG8552360.1 hypothetical protein [Hymenobacter guriensis]
MKKLLLSLVLILVCYTVRAQNVKALDEKNGFRDARFWADTTAIKDLVYLTTSQDRIRYYKRTSDSPSIGNAQVDISYGFYKGRLMAVVLTTNSASYLLDALKASYGPGIQNNRYIPEYFWLGQQVYMSFKEDTALHTAQAVIISRTMQKQQEEDNKKAAEKAKAEL